MKIYNDENVAAIYLEGTIYMYGSICVAAKKCADKMLVTITKGSDGGKNGSTEEKYYASHTFEKLVQALTPIDVELEELDECNVFKAKEADEETGGYEWFLSLSDEDGELLMRICGNCFESDSFKKINQALSDVCNEYKNVENFFVEFNNKI